MVCTDAGRHCKRGTCAEIIATGSEVGMRAPWCALVVLDQVRLQKPFRKLLRPTNSVSLGIWKARSNKFNPEFGWIEMGSQSSIANRIAPIDQTLLFVSVHGFQPRWYLRQISGIACRTFERVVHQFVIRVVCSNAPIAARVIAPLISLDQLAFAQAARHRRCQVKRHRGLRTCT